jgi:hypothetical protein
MRRKGILMLDELMARLPSVDDLLSLAAPQLDGILLKCIAQRATSTDPIAAKYVFEDEIVGLYPIGVNARFPEQHGRKWRPHGNLASTVIRGTNNATGQAARMMTLTAKVREAAGSVEFEEITMRQMLRRELLHSDLQGSVYENFARAITTPPLGMRSLKLRLPCVLRPSCPHRSSG